jgi:hypothetical protein
MPTRRALSFIPAFCVLLLLGVSSQALAWGAMGHRVIGALAEERLTPAAYSAIKQLLQDKDLATVSTWADEMRSSRDKPEFWSTYAANWHYVNIAPGADYASSVKNQRGDAYAALETFVAILLDAPVPEGPVHEGLVFYFGDLDTRDADVKRFALSFLVHILGDLQQPFHSGYADDRGGNEARVTWFGAPSNLHAVWDTQLLERSGLAYPELARRLSGRIARTPASDVRFWESAAPLVWISEARETLDRIYARHATQTELDSRYTASFVPTAELQLIKGGLRTAFVLNSIFGGWPIGSWRDSPTAGTTVASQ